MAADENKEVIAVSESTDTDDSDICYVAAESYGSGYCRICDLNLIDVMVYPCTHASICHACFNRLSTPRRCPICQATVTKHEMFFLV